MREMAEENVKISVIMGVYNPDREQLKRAAASIIAQTVEEWEMIVYDDGSDMTYTETIRETAAMDGRIRYIRNMQNHGLAYALDQCMKEAKGKYIARMDADDESMPERFETQYSFLEAHREYAWAGSNAELFDGQGTWGVRRMPQIPEKKDFLKASPYIHPSVMFRRRTLMDNHGYIPAQVTRRCEDYELFMRLHMRGYRGYNIQKELIRYREDDAAYKKRLMCYRINEMRIRKRFFQRMDLLTPATALCVLRPLMGGLAPAPILKYIHRMDKNVTTKRNRKHAENMSQGLQKIQKRREKRAGV